ncbi:MAG TPA: PepSY domain-containing protein [Steroidobacteraceae bacterium]|nr:PepSY domain-containing protein [Steroidobacteraceae bacterium]
MNRLGTSTNRWLTWFHRWAGVVLCLFFAMWFASGAVLHFVGFPALPMSERHAAGEPVEVSRLRLAPRDALARVPNARELRLVGIAGRPVYVARPAGGAWQSVAGDTGGLFPVSAGVAREVAGKFGRSAVAEVTGPFEYDQWVVHQNFDPYRPFFRVRLNDTDRTDLYVSSRTGEVVQRTRFAERAWNWAGAVVHWIYFTPLRKSWSAWNQTVWWLSLAAVLSSGVGTWLGLLRMMRNRAAGRPGLSPFRGWMRWHHIIGLFASVVVVAWILSGWLSMDHGRLFSHGEASATEVDRLRGMSLEAIADSAPLELLARLPPSTSIGFNGLAGRSFLTTYGPLAQAPRIFLADQPAPSTVPALPDALLQRAVENVWPGAVRLQRSGSLDELYRRAESVGDDAAAFTVGAGLRIYVDRFSGRLLAVMNSSRRDYAWIYYALHTLQFPGLIDHPEVRTIIVLLLLAVGFVFSVTGVVLSWVRLRREFA